MRSALSLPHSLSLWLTAAPSQPCRCRLVWYLLKFLCSGPLSLVSLLLTCFKDDDEESGEEDAEGLLIIAIISRGANVSGTACQRWLALIGTSETSVPNCSGTEGRLYSQTVNDYYPHFNTTANQPAVFIHQLLFHTWLSLAIFQCFSQVPFNL